MRFSVYILFSAALLVSGAGCSGSPETTADAGDHPDGDHHAGDHESDHHDDHDDDEDHHHHHEAEHRPADFPDAVRAAGRRHREVLEELEHGHVDHLDHEVEELLDVIDWLPEFAADSDMRRAPWDRVHAATKQLRGAYAVVEQKLAEGAVPVADDVDVDAAEQALAELDSLVGTEKGDRP